MKPSRVLCLNYNNPKINSKKSLNRPVAYAELGDDVDSDWDKDSSVVHKEEEEEDTELFEEEGGKVN